MKRILTLTVAAFIAAAPFAAVTEDHAADHAVEATATEAAPAAVAPVEYVKADGTKVVVEGDAAFVVAADGTKTPAPDGEHEFTDGTKVTVAAGLIVAPAPAAEAPAADAVAQ